MRTYRGWIRRARSACATMLLLGLAGCGGGGGADEAPAVDTTHTAPLVEPAPRTGPLLAATGGLLRAQASGQRRTWRIGNDDEVDGTTEFIPLADSFRETRHDGEPGEVFTRVAANGDVTLRSPVRVGCGLPPLDITGLELRSPVTTGDQYVLFEGPVAATDVDSDGKAEIANVAVFRRVIGREAVPVAFLADPLDAVRVDTFVACRVTPSGGGGVRTERLRDAAWYAERFGLVGSARVSATGALFERRDLAGIDGLAGDGPPGVGVVNAPAVVLPAPAGYGTIAPWMVAPLPDGAMVVYARRVVEVGLRGEARASTPDPLPTEFSMLAATAKGPRLFAIDDGWQVTMSALDKVGERLVPRRVGALPLGTTVTSIQHLGHATSPEGTAVWTTLGRQVQDGAAVREQIWVRRWDADGLASAVDVSLPTTSRVSSVGLDALPDGVLVAWLDAATQSLHVASIADDGTVRWNVRHAVLAGSVRVRVLHEGDRAWVLWGDWNDVAFGAALDLADGRLTGAGASPSAVFGPLNPDLANGWPSTSVRGGHLHLAGRESRQATGNLALKARHRYWMLQPPSGPFAGSLKTVHQVLVLQPWTAGPPHPVVFDDRVLLLNVRPDGVLSTVVYGDTRG